MSEIWDKIKASRQKSSVGSPRVVSERERVERNNRNDFLRASVSTYVQDALMDIMHHDPDLVNPAVYLFDKENNEKIFREDAHSGYHGGNTLNGSAFLEYLCRRDLTWGSTQPGGERKRIIVRIGDIDKGWSKEYWGHDLARQIAVYGGDGCREVEIARSYYLKDDGTLFPNVVVNENIPSTQWYEDKEKTFDEWFALTLDKALHRPLTYYKPKSYAQKCADEQEYNLREQERKAYLHEQGRQEAEWNSTHRNDDRQ